MATDPLILQPGVLRHSITIQSASSTRDAAGQPVNAWNQVLATRARIENAGGGSYKESFSNNSFSSQSTDLVTIRWPGAAIDIKPGMRIVFGDNRYLIQAVDNILRRNRVLRLACLVIDGD